MFLAVDNYQCKSIRACMNCILVNIRSFILVKKVHHLQSVAYAAIRVCFGMNKETKRKLRRTEDDAFRDKHCVG